MTEVTQMVARYPAQDGSHDLSARFARSLFEQLGAARGAPRLQLDLRRVPVTEYRWINQTVLDRLLPYCASRGIALTVEVADRAVRADLLRAARFTGARVQVQLCADRQPEATHHA